MLEQLEDNWRSRLLTSTQGQTVTDDQGRRFAGASIWRPAMALGITANDNTGETDAAGMLTERGARTPDAKG